MNEFRDGSSKIKIKQSPIMYPLESLLAAGDGANIYGVCLAVPAPPPPACWGKAASPKGQGLDLQIQMGAHHSFPPSHGGWSVSAAPAVGLQTTHAMGRDGELVTLLSSLHTQSTAGPSPSVFTQAKLPLQSLVTSQVPAPIVPTGTRWQSLPPGTWGITDMHRLWAGSCWDVLGACIGMGGDTRRWRLLLIQPRREGSYQKRGW